MGLRHIRDRNKVQLAPRELDVLRCVCRGQESDKDISRALRISPGTASNYVQLLYGKLRVSTRASLLRIAILYPEILEHGIAILVDHSENCTCLVCARLRFGRVPASKN